MRCFYHPRREAVGVCSVCGKGLCRNCAVEKGGFIYCKEHAPKVGRPKPLPRRAAKRPYRFKPPKVEMRFHPKSTVTPAIVGGIISGMVLGIPFINLLFPLWMFIGGALSVYLLLIKLTYEKRVAGCLRPVDGVIVGGIGGFFSANVGVLLSAFAGVLIWDPVQSIIVSLGTDPGTAQILFNIIVMDPNLNIGYLLGKYFVFLILAPLIGALGGYVTAKLTR